jgi:uncharacterized membrane protein HdeD (DUF308 family)
MVVGGAGQIIQAFQVKNWAGFLYWLLSRLLYAVAGFITFSNPLLAATVLTLMLTVALIVSGGLSIWSGIQSSPETGRAWVTASGLITLPASIIVALGWPANTVWLLGLVLTIYLTFQGVTSIAFRLALTQVPTGTVTARSA